MITALFSFLGGSVFRMIFGEVVSFFDKKMEHSREIERMRLQAELDAAQFDRNQQAIKLQSELQVKVIEAQTEAHISEVEVDGWLEAVKAVGQKVGIAWVDGWNAVIRPAVATWAIIMMTLSEFAVFTISENALAVCSAALGIYLAERSLFKRGK